MNKAAETANGLRSVVSATVATGFAGQAALMLSGMLVARMLGLNGRGLLAALILWPSLIAHMGSLGLPTAATYFIIKKGASTNAVAKTLLPIAIPQALLLVALHGVVLLVVGRGDPTLVRAASILTLAAVPAHLAQAYGLALLQGNRRFKLFNIQRLLSASVYACGVLALFLVNTGGILQIVAIWMAVNVTVGAATLALGLRSGVGESETRSDLKRGEMVRFGLSGLVGSVSPIERYRLDQVVVALFLSPSALGLYVVALSFTNALRFLAQSVGMVAYPTIAAVADPDAARRSMWAFVRWTLLLSIVLTIPLILLVGWLIPFFFGEAFRHAAPVTQILLGGMVFASLRRVLADGLRGRGLPTAGTIAEVAAWLWLVPALAVLVPLLGVRGVAYALSSSYAVSLGVLLIVASSHGELRLQSVLRGSPRAAFNRLRLSISRQAS